MERLCDAIHYKVQLFQDKRPNQGIGTIRFDARAERAFPVLQLQPDVFHTGTFDGPLIRITNLDLACAR